MKINVYTKDETVKYVELNVDVTELFVIKKALNAYAGDSVMSAEDRIVAVMITEDMKEPERVELDEFN